MARFTIFSANYLPNIGGVERFTEGLAGELGRMGHEVTIVTNNVFALPARERLTDGVSIVRLPCHPCLNGRMPLPRRNRDFREAWRGLLDAPCDGVLVNTRFYMHTLLGLGYAEAKGLRPVVLDHGSAYLTFGNPVLDLFVRAYEDGITRVVKRHGPDFYGISRRSVDWLAHFGINAKGVISNALDAEAYRAQASGRDFRRDLGIPTGDMLVVFTGRLIPEKGVEALTLAMRKVADEPIALVMAGDGPLRQRIQGERSANVHLVGRLDQPDIAALLLQADLFCLPTRSEGFSTSLLEASACGTPSLITNVGGVEELIPGPAYGTVLPDARPETVARELKRLQGERRDSLAAQGENARKRVERDFSWRATAERVVAALDDAGSVSPATI